MKRLVPGAVLALCATAGPLTLPAPAQVGAPFCFGTGCPCGNDDPEAGCGNAGLDGDPSSGALLEAIAGDGVVFPDELVLRVSGVQSGQAGLVFMGGGVASAPFGDGLACVAPGSGSLVRFAVQSADADGAFTDSRLVCQSRALPGGEIGAGETWYFQGWYRDPQGPCGSGFNLTNGLPVTFQPPSGPIAAQLAGSPLVEYPRFDAHSAFLEGLAVHVALDPLRFWYHQGQAADLYVVAAKSEEEWGLDPTLVDARGAPQSIVLDGSTLAEATFLVDDGTLNGTLGTQVGVGYDVVVDFDGDGLLSAGDLVDGLSDEAGFYVVRDTAAPGPYQVVEVFDNAGSFLLKDIYYPENLAALGRVPLVVVSHGNGHSYTWYDHIGFHLASYGYVVMSHRNNTQPGPNAASLTTLENTDHLLGNLDTIAGGVLDGHVDGRQIVWIGHSRGGEGVVRAYDRLFDGSYAPSFFTIDDVRLVSSIAPTNFLGINSANPHGVDYHLWVGSADDDVTGGPGTNIGQSYQLYERATDRTAAITIQGAGHGAFHDGGGSLVAEGPCILSRPKVHAIMRGYLLPLVRHFLEGDAASRDFLWRSYEVLRPPGAPAPEDPCAVVHLEYEPGSAADAFVLDDYQNGEDPGTSSSHGVVAFDVLDTAEQRLDDLNATFTWLASDPMNGMTRASNQDATRGVVFTWSEPSSYELAVVPQARDLSDDEFLSFRACQGTRHPQTIAELGDLAFTVTLRDGQDRSSSIRVDAYGSGVGEPYQRAGAGTGVGWANEYETIRIRLTDFQSDGSGLDLRDVHALRFEFGAGSGSAQGRLALDDVKLTQE